MDRLARGSAWWGGGGEGREGGSRGEEGREEKDVEGNKENRRRGGI